MIFDVPKECRNGVGIYSLTNVVNGKRLIGQTINFRARFGRYNSKLTRGDYKNSHLQNSFNQYGTDNFKMELVNLCDEENLTEMETYFCKAFNTLDRRFGYNKKDPVKHGKFTDDSRKRRSESMMGQQMALGYKHTEAAKRAISDALIGNKRTKGHKLTEEHKRKVSDALKGRKPWNTGTHGLYTEDRLKKMSVASKGRVVTEEVKRKISASHMGMKASDETRRAMSEGHKRKKLERLVASLNNAENNFDLQEGICLSNKNKDNSNV